MIFLTTRREEEKRKFGRGYLYSIRRLSVIDRTGCAKKKTREHKASMIFSHLDRSFSPPFLPLAFPYVDTPAGVSNSVKVQSAKPRDRQCGLSARCSTSMTIAGNFVRCVLAPSLPPRRPPPFPSQPVLIHVAIHPPVRSFISPRPIQFARPNL